MRGLVCVVWKKIICIYALFRKSSRKFYHIIVEIVYRISLKKVSETLYVYVIGYEVSYSVGAPVERGGPIHRPSLVKTQRVDSVASNGGANRKLDIL